MQRKCRYVPLKEQPLVLVLCQVRFSLIREIAKYIPAIQENFRRHGFPIERPGKIQQFVFSSAGVQTVDQERWEYRTKDEQWSVLILQDSLVLQTTAYDRFEGFAEKLEEAVTTVLQLTEHDRFGVIERVGLRTIDVIQPRDGEGYRQYLRPGLHGVADEVFLDGTQRLHVETVGQTPVGTMLVRVKQNDQGYDLPPDLVATAPKHTSRTSKGEVATLVDLDHFIEGSFDPKAKWVIERVYELHDHMIETFHEHIVTKHAIEVWK